jgi:hypothetical protein
VSDKSRTAKQQVEDMIAKRLSAKAEQSSFDKTTIEYAVYEFIQKMEELAKLTNSSGDDVIRAKEMIRMVHKDLQRKIKRIDPMSAGFDVMYSEHEVEGVRWPKLEYVTIKWSEKFAQDNNIDREFNISVSEIILRYCF